MGRTTDDSGVGRFLRNRRDREPMAGAVTGPGLSAPGRFGEMSMPESGLAPGVTEFQNDSVFSQWKMLPRVPPPWVRPGELFFVTVCCQRRGVNVLAREEIARSLFDALEAYVAAGRWYVRLMVLMPDHLHALMAVPAEEDLQRVVRSWKRFLARTVTIEWQRDFFDHRLRNDESCEEKSAYIRDNPVRAGLVARPEDWPYVWEPKW